MNAVRAGTPSIAQDAGTASEAAQSGTDLTVDYGANDSVTLIGVQFASLHEDDFIR